MAKLAINGGTPVRTKPYIWPIVGEEEEKLVMDVVKSGKWGHCMSPDCEVTKFEKKYADYFGVKYAISIHGGSTALEYALRSIGIGPNDEVITPALTWVATQMAAVLIGADPVFVDVCPDNYCIDPEKIKEAITPKTKAIIPVHLGGYLCDMNKIMEISKEYNLPVIEDCAQAHGSRYDGKLAGTIGKFGCFSFEISKIMTAGEGGMIITNDKEKAEYIYSATNAGWAYGNRGNYPDKIPGWNLRMTEFQAVLLSFQLDKLEERKRKRLKNALYLTEQLSKIEGIKPLKQDPDQNYFSYFFKFDSAHFNDIPVQKFREALEAEGIIRCFSSASHQLVYKMYQFCSPRKDYSNVSCPEAEKAFYKEAVGLSASGMLLAEKEDMDDIVNAIIKIKENCNELSI